MLSQKNIRSLHILIVLSALASILQLVGPIYMMQVFDRVLASGSIQTLVGLSLIALILYLFLGMVDYYRRQLFLTEGEALSERLRVFAFQNALSGHALEATGSDNRRALDDLDTVRSFLTSPGFAAIFELAFMPIFLVFIFLLHWMLGVTSLIAAAILTLLAIANERSIRKSLEENGALSRKAKAWSQKAEQEASYLIAGGHRDHVIARGVALDQEARIAGSSAAIRSSAYLSVTKTTRLAIQSMILGLGAYLAVAGELSPGGVIAASIVFSRTLAPIEQILGNFGLLMRARTSWQRVKVWEQNALGSEKMPLPAPTKSLKLKINALCPPGYEEPILKAVQFQLDAGDVLGIVGPSGGGKSSLSKALVGAWPVKDGTVRLDDGDLQDWPSDTLSKAIGYLPQEIELFDGTLEQNISGFDPGAQSEQVIKAAKLAGAHELFLTFPDGYNTGLGPAGIQLSAGQKQRVALARALYGNPFLVVLDEPNSNLDEDGEMALAAAVRHLRRANKIVVIIAHREGILRLANKICVIRNGAMYMFGPMAAVRKRLAEERSGNKQEKTTTKTSPTQREGASS